MRCLVLVLCLFCVGCSSFSYKTPVDRLPLNLKDPEPIYVEPVEFVVIHKDNAAAVFSILESRGEEPVVFALTGDDYKALATNIERIKNYLLLQRSIIRRYREYYEPLQ